MRYLLTIIALFLLLTESPAHACSCGGWGSDRVEAVEMAYEAADIVFLGRVETVEDITEDDDGYARQIQVTTLFVLDSWKGEESNRIVTRIDTTCCLCGFAFVEDRDYLVFGYKRDDGFYSTSTCSLTTSGEQVDELSAILDDLVAGD